MGLPHERVVNRHPQSPQTHPLQPLKLGVPADTGSSAAHCDRVPSEHHVLLAPLLLTPHQMNWVGDLLQLGFNPRVYFRLIPEEDEEGRKAFLFHLLSDLILEGLGQHRHLDTARFLGRLGFTTLIKGAPQTHQALHCFPAGVIPQGLGDIRLR